MTKAPLPAPRVFISSTKDDLIEYRDAARDAAIQAGFLPVMMEYFTASGERPPLDACLARVDEADLVIALVAHRFGWIPDGQPAAEVKSVTWLECERVASKTPRIEVIPLIVEPGEWWPHDRRDSFRMTKALQEGKASPELLAEVQQAMARLEDFKAWLNGLGVRATFKSADEVGRHVATALTDWRLRHPDFGRADGPVGDHKAALMTYRRELAKATQFLPLRGIDVGASDPTGDAARLELAKVYVTLATTTSVPLGEARPSEKAWWRRFAEHAGLARPEPSVDEPTGPMRGEKTRPLGALEAISRHRRVVMLGGPGSGKSTLLNHLTFCLVQHHLEPQSDWVSQLEGWGFDDTDVVPVVVVLRDFARRLDRVSRSDATQSNVLWTFVTSTLEERNLGTASGAIRQALDDGRALVLLDGLDEVTSKEARATVGAAVRAFAGRFDKSRFVVTCRTLSYQEPETRLEGFPSFEIAPFDNEQIAAFVGAWYAELLRVGQIDAHLSLTYAERLKEATRRADLSQLAPNPLLLTVMALVHTHKGRLPDARAQLYEEIVDILLWRWEGRRGDEGVGLMTLLREVGKSESDLKRVLWRLAFETHRAGGSTSEGTADISERALVDALRALDPKGSRDWAWSLVEVIKLRAGLLLEREPGVFAFPHRTFQEYLAGAHLSVQETFTTRGAQLASDPSLWRPAILLATGRLVHVMGAVERPLALAMELCPPSVDASIAPENVSRRVWLAGEVLEEVGTGRLGGSETGRDLAARVPRCLVQILERGALTPVERCALGTTLGRLGDPRFDATQWSLPVGDTLGFAKVDGGPFLMGSDPNKGYSGDDEKPQHTADVPTFYIGRFPVTVAQFGAFVAAAGSTLSAPERFHGVANHPVMNVSWHEALGYCGWLTERLREWSGAPPETARWLDTTVRDGWEVALPSEAQWEKAARGTKGAVYPWGDESDPMKANTSEPDIGGTSPVGAFPNGRSPFGALDMSGNVFEWTKTAYKPYPYRADDGREGLKGDDRRVARGGSFRLSDLGARAAFRCVIHPVDRDNGLGFRVVVSRSLS